MVSKGEITEKKFHLENFLIILTLEGGWLHL